MITGKIDWVIDIPTGDTVQLNAMLDVYTEHYFTEITNPDEEIINYYIDSGVLTERPEWTFSTWSKTTIDADGVDSATITGLLNPSIISIDVIEGVGIIATDDIEVTDGSFTLKSNQPGTFSITINHFPYKPFTTIIEAV